ARQLDRELLHLEERLEDAARRRGLQNPPPHDLRGVATDRRVRVEPRVEHPADVVEIEQRLAEHRELTRDVDSAVAADARGFEHDAADLDRTQVRVAAAPRDELREPLAE